MKKIIFSILLCASSYMMAQDVFSSKTGKVSFFSKAAMENIDATNSESVIGLNIVKGGFLAKMAITDFKFKNALMQEHFNENYMESATIPDAKFKGDVLDIAKIDLSKDGKHSVKIEGDLTIHGVLKHRIIEGTLERKNGEILVVAKFPVKLADHNVKIPTAVFQKIAEVVDVEVSATLSNKK